MSVSSASRIPLQGQLATTGVAEVLQKLEEQRTTGRVHFETEVGQAEVSFVAGSMVEAHMGDLAGRDALFRLLGIVDGRFEVSSEPVEARDAITPSVARLMTERSQRAFEWRRLSEQAPPLSSVLKLAASGGDSLREGGTDHETKVLFGLIDERRTITEIIDESGLDAVKALGLLIGALQRGAVSENSSAGAQGSLFPLRPDAGGAFEIVLPKAPNLPAAMGESPSPAFSGVALRRTTVMGLGIQGQSAAASPPAAIAAALAAPRESAPRAGAAEVRRIISIGAHVVATPPPPAEPLSLGEKNTSSREVALSEPVPPAPSSEASAAGASERAFQAAPVEALADVAAAPNAKYVGRYEVLCRIGRGGMGSVYLCRLTTEGGFRRLFALKLLRSHLLQDSEAAQRFIEEARLAGYVHHPNVVSVLDAGLHGSQPYLVMDYVEGGSLKQLLSTRPGVRAPELILPIVLDALAGLHAAHTLVGDDGVPLDIVHCDVSPENLIVGIDGVCRLTDFGVAKHGPISREREQVTHGKPGHLAPEQILGNRIDRRADIFAMGVVLYNALTGTKLFDAPTQEETLEFTCSRRIDPPSTVGLRPPPSLDFVCMKALEREPERRFDNAEDMMMELRRIALRENLLAPTSDIAAWVREAVGRELTQRRLALLDASRKAAAGGGGVGASLPSRPPPPVTAIDAAANPAGSAGARPDSDAPNSAGAREHDHFTHTVLLQPASGSGRRWALVTASALAALAILATLLWPNLVSKMFRLNTERVVSGEVQLDPGAGSVSLRSDTGSAGTAASALPSTGAPTLKTGSQTK